MSDIAVCLMGPTASGKTDIAVELTKRFPFDIISVDSALVYRGMDIGTAKPDAETLARAPHRLVDIRNPEDTYSAGNFVSDATMAISEIQAVGRIPLLVGGTMMYFRALTEGIADLPPADAEIRARIDAEAAEKGWPAMHRELTECDSRSAAKINPNDSQRIQRALEVFLVSGVPLSERQAKNAAGDTGADRRFIKLGLYVEPRQRLHQRIEDRLNIMINNGFEEEVKQLMKRSELHADLPSMRSVGYRQFWEYLEGVTSRDEAAARSLFATRQLAKRQITWMRSERHMQLFDALDKRVIDAISAAITAQLP